MARDLIKEFIDRTTPLLTESKTFKSYDSANEDDFKKILSRLRTCISNAGGFIAQEVARSFRIPNDRRLKNSIVDLKRFVKKIQTEFARLEGIFYDATEPAENAAKKN